MRQASPGFVGVVDARRELGVRGARQRLLLLLLRIDGAPPGCAASRAVWVVPRCVLREALDLEPAE